MTAPPPLALPVPDLAAVGTPIDTLAPARSATGGPGARLRAIRAAALVFRREFAATAMPTSVSTHDLYTLPYPTKFGLWRAASSPAPFLAITNRLLVVRWLDGDTTRTMLFEPSDVDLDANAPYLAYVAGLLPPALRGVFSARHGDVLGHLRALGIDPAEVDYLVFDHLHTQDVRRWLGTTRPQPDISPDRPVEPAFPRARLVVQRAELEAMTDLHPLQRPWYQPETFVDLRPESIAAIEGDVLLGPGVALLATPGHVLGNQTLVLNTSSGIWASSENAIAAECMWPQESRIAGVARWAAAWGQEVVLNANTIETAAEQYNSMVLEKTLVDRAAADERFGQFFPSSELTRHWSAPGVAPTFTHAAVTHGAGATRAAGRPAAAVSAAERRR